MALWLFRAGRYGEYEDKFLNDEKVYLTWDELDVDLRSIESRDRLTDLLVEKYELDKRRTAINWTSQIWPIAHRMEIGDWVVLPSKRSRTLHFGEITGDYVFDKSQENPYYHYRSVKWFAKDIPRDRFDQDILYSLGAFMTVCKIHRNNAEERIKEMYHNNWHIPKQESVITQTNEDDETVEIDIYEYIEDQISKLIIRKFKGHKMERLIQEILEAKGFTTFRGPEGADYGIDILASSGELGFGSPRICVQVKTQDEPVDRPTLDQLIGAMANVNADYGLLVSWSGFKQTVLRELPKQFFKVRLWDANKIIEEIFDNYEKLSNDTKAEIPLKRVWMLHKED